MADLLKLDPERIDSCLGPLTFAANDGLVNICNDLKNSIDSLGVDNELQQELLDGCAKVANKYNDGFMTSLNAVIEDFKAVVDISEYLEKKATVGEFSTVDTGTVKKRIDTSAVMP